MKSRQFIDGSEFPPALQYMLDIWHELCAAKDPEIESFLGGDAFTTHAILILLEDELLYNGLKNKSLRHVFRELLACSLKKAFALPPASVVGVQLVIKNLESNDGLLLALVADALVPFRNKNHLLEVIELLEKEFLNDEWNSKRGGLITDLCNEVISELRILGCSSEAIAACEHEVENWFRLTPGAVTQLGATKADRRATLDCVKEKALKDKKTHIIIFAVIGMSGDQELRVGDVVIYNPKASPRVVGPANGFNEVLHDHGINIAVPIRAMDVDQAVVDAWIKANRVLDFLHVAVSHKSRLVIVKEKYIWVDDQWGCKGAGSSITQEQMDAVGLFSINTRRIEGRNPMLAVSSMLENAPFALADSERKLRDALAWMRKADNVVRDDDAILSYWVALEKVFTFNDPWTHGGGDAQSPGKMSKYDLIEQVVPKMLAVRGLCTMDLTFYNYMWSGVNSATNGQRCLPLPDEYIARFGMRRGHVGEISRKEFVDSMSEVMSATIPLVVIDRAEYLKKIYKDRKCAAMVLERAHDKASRELQILYRYRNSIVHNAHSDLVLLPLLRKRARRMAALVIECLVGAIQSDGTPVDVRGVLFRNVSRYLRMLSELKEMRPVTMTGHPDFWS